MQIAFPLLAIRPGLAEWKRLAYMDTSKYTHSQKVSFSRTKLLLHGLLEDYPQLILGTYFAQKITGTGIDDTQLVSLAYSLFGALSITKVSAK